MAYFATTDVQPITKGQAKKTHPTAGLGCSPYAADGGIRRCGQPPPISGFGAVPIVAVSGLGDSASVTNLLKYGALGALAGAGVMYLAAKATGPSTQRAKKFAKYGALFGAAAGGLYFGGPAQQTAPITTMENLQPPVAT